MEETAKYSAVSIIAILFTGKFIICGFRKLFVLGFTSLDSTIYMWQQLMKILVMLCMCMSTVQETLMKQGIILLPWLFLCFLPYFMPARHHVKGWLTTVLMDYNSPTSNSLQPCSKMFFVLYLLFCELLPFYVKLEQSSNVTNG